MKSIIMGFSRGNIIPLEGGRPNAHEVQQLLEYISRHNDDLQKIMTDEQEKTFEKFHDCWSKYASLLDEA